MTKAAGLGGEIGTALAFPSGSGDIRASLRLRGVFARTSQLPFLEDIREVMYIWLI